MKLSVIIPIYNEFKTLEEILKRIINQTHIEKEIILIDDFSTDGSRELIKNKLKSKVQKIRLNEKNYGKGYSVRQGIEIAEGDIILIQDADLEYDPNEYQLLLQPILDGYADVVYGSRFVGGRPHRMLFFFHSIGNHILTFLSNVFSNLNLSDMETCYKLFRADIIKQLYLKECRFGFEPEVTAKISRIKDIRIYEVGISYYGRTYKEGKKIGWKDGLRAIYCIIKYGLLKL